MDYYFIIIIIEVSVLTLYKHLRQKVLVVVGLTLSLFYNSATIKATILQVKCEVLLVSSQVVLKSMWPIKLISQLFYWFSNVIKPTPVIAFPLALASSHCLALALLVTIDIAVLKSPLSALARPHHRNLQSSTSEPVHDASVTQPRNSP